MRLLVTHSRYRMLERRDYEYTLGGIAPTRRNRVGEQLALAAIEEQVVDTVALASTGSIAPSKKFGKDFSKVKGKEPSKVPARFFADAVQGSHTNLPRTSSMR